MEMDNVLLKLVQLTPTFGKLTIESVDIGNSERAWHITLADYVGKNQSLREACESVLKQHVNRHNEIGEAFKKL